jgi:DNA-directed RNA polymerase subunit RPC12/RpoP
MIRDLFLLPDGGVKPWVTYAVLTLAVVEGGYFVYAAWTAEDKPTAGTWICMTPSCGRSVRRGPQLGENMPAKCPKCGNESLVPAYSCPGCKTPLALNEYRGTPPPTKCRNCGLEVWYGQ